MSTLNAFGQPNHFSNILHPALSHRFRVKFVSSDSEPLPEDLKILSSQLVSVSQRELFSDAFGLSSGCIDVVFEEDIQHFLLKALTKLRSEYCKQFDMHIEFLSGTDDVLRTTIYKQCQLASATESVLDYSLSSIEETMTLKTSNGPIRTDEIVEAISKNEQMFTWSALLALIGKANLTLTQPKKKKKFESVSVQVHVQFCYESITTVFPE